MPAEFELRPEINLAFRQPGCSRKSREESMRNFEAFAETGADIRKTGNAQ